MQSNIVPVFDNMLERKDKEKLLNQKAKCFWFTGLSGSGKSTIAIEAEKRLYNLGIKTMLLDGDNVRTGINNNLGFSISDRDENIRRIAEINKLFLSAGLVTINCFVSPLNSIRNNAKSIIGSNDFYLVYVSTPIEECERRDVKGLYVKAREGKISDFTGVNSPFEEPLSPWLTIEADKLTIEESVDLFINNVLPIIEYK